jgi:exonuclease VII small subunit
MSELSDTALALSTLAQEFDKAEQLVRVALQDVFDAQDVLRNLIDDRDAIERAMKLVLNHATKTI